MGCSRYRPTVKSRSGSFRRNSAALAVANGPWEGTRMTTSSRRNVLKGGAALTGTLALGFPAIVRAQTDKIKIGHLTPLTGFLGALGAYAQLGMRMAEEEINKAGGVMGRPIEVMSEDSVNPATAATKAQRMLVQDGAAFLMGEI